MTVAAFLRLIHERPPNLQKIETTFARLREQRVIDWSCYESLVQLYRRSKQGDIRMLYTKMKQELEPPKFSTLSSFLKTFGDRGDGKWALTVYKDMRLHKMHIDNHTYQRVIPLHKKHGQLNWLRRDFREYISIWKAFNPAVYLSAGKGIGKDREFAKDVAEATLARIPQQVQQEHMEWVYHTLGYCMHADVALGFEILNRLEALSIPAHPHFKNLMLAGAVSDCIQRETTTSETLNRVFKESRLDPAKVRESEDVNSIETYLQGLVELGEMELAERIFARFSCPTIRSFTLLINAWASRGHCVRAEQLFRKARVKGFLDCQLVSSLQLDPKIPEQAELLFTIHSDILKEVLKEPLLAFELCGCLRILQLGEKANPFFSQTQARAHAEQIILFVEALIGASKPPEQIVEELRADLHWSYARLMENIERANNVLMATPYTDSSSLKAQILESARVGYYGGVDRLMEYAKKTNAWRDVEILNALIQAQVWHDRPETALSLFDFALEKDSGVKPNKETIVTLMMGMINREKDADWLWKESQIILGALDPDVLGQLFAVVQPPRALTIFRGLVPEDRDRVFSSPTCCYQLLKVCATLGETAEAEGLISRLKESDQCRGLEHLIRCYATARRLKVKAAQEDMYTRGLFQRISRLLDVSSNKRILSNLLELSRLEDDKESYNALENMLASKFKAREHCTVVTFLEDERRLEVANGWDSKGPNFLHPVEWLSELISELRRKDRYQPDLSVPSDFYDKSRSDEQRRLDIEGHAEKKALAYLLRNRGKIHIRVHGMRVCKDCHRFAQLCAMRYSRRIFIQDVHKLNIFLPG